MIRVTPQAQVDLEDSVFHLAVSGQGHVATIARTGSGTFFAPNLTSPQRFSIPSSIRLAELSQDGREMAVITSSGITFYSTATFERTDYWNDAFESCMFASGLFWTCTRFTAVTKVVEVWDAKTKTRIARRKVADPFSDGGFFLFPHPSQNSAVIYAGGGQDGQKLFWAMLDGETIQVQRFKDLSFASRPAFCLDGRAFVVSDGERLARYAYPDGPLLGTIGDLAGEFCGDCDCLYLDARHALVPSAAGRLFVLNIERMEIVDELVIHGFEDRPMSPSQGFYSQPDRSIVSLHGDPGAEMGDKCTHLVQWSVPLP